MGAFKSMPNSSENQKFLQNFQDFRKETKVNSTVLLRYLEDRILSILQNSYNLQGVAFKSIRIDQGNGDLVINVNENGTVHRYVNPNTGLPTNGGWLPYIDWEQNENDINDKGEPVDEHGMTRSEYDKSEENLMNFGWDEILFSKSWAEWFWGKSEQDEQNYLDKIKKLDDELGNWN
jgi:hypothetical protein